MEKAPDFILFLGRFHPLVVHLPIGFLMIAFIMEIMGRTQKYAQLGLSTGFVLLLGAISASLAALMGWFLSWGGGYNADTLFWHQWLGIGVAVTAWIAWLIKTKPQLIKGKLTKAYLPVFSISTFMLLVAGHYGGSLTHGGDYLFQYAPQPIRTIAGLPPKTEKKIKVIENIDEALVFDDIVHPMLEARCNSCHNEGKMKGELRMDTREKFLEGGENGPVIVAGNADQSELYRRVMLPEEEEEHMPPDGKRPLTENQIELIAWWIDAGAPMDKKVAEIEAPERIQGLLAKLGPGGDKAKGIFAKSVTPADPAAMEKLAARGVMVMPIAQDINFLQVTIQKDSVPFGAADMKLLLPLAEQITWLDMRNTQTDDYSVLASLPNLSKLHLEKTGVKDVDLVHISGLTNLEYLNMYGTEVSNEGIKNLEGLTNLKSLYLWQTKVDKSAAEALKEKLPALSIDMGWEPVPLDTIQAMIWIDFFKNNG